MAVRRHALFKKTYPSWIHGKSSCFVYEGKQEEGIDFGVEMEGYGALFLSRTAIREAAEVLGFSFEEEGVKLEQENAHLQHELEQTRAERDALREELDSFGAAVARYVSVKDGK